MSALRAVKDRWAVLRARFPRGSARVESAALGVRGYPRLVAEVRDLRARMHELERDHALLAAHVATLTERAFGTAETADSGALERARLSAVAAYEHRIQALESRLGGRRHARGPSESVSGTRTSGEPRSRAS